MKKLFSVLLVLAMVFAFCTVGSPVGMAEGNFWLSLSDTLATLSEEAKNIGENGLDILDDVKGLIPEDTMNDIFGAVAGSLMESFMSGSSSVAQENEIASSYPETVLADNEFCSVVLTAIDPFNAWGYTLKVRCENKSDRSITCTVDQLTVNSCMATPYWEQEIPAGETVESEIGLTAEKFGLVEELLFTLSAYETDDPEMNRVLSEECALYPTGADQNSVTPFRPDLENAVTLVENDDVTVCVLSAGKDELFGFDMNLWCENKTDSALSFRMDAISVNGVEMDPYWNENAAAGKNILSEVIYFDSEFPDGAVPEITDIEFRLVAEAEGADPVLDETFTVAPFAAPSAEPAADSAAEVAAA